MPENHGSAPGPDRTDGLRFRKAQASLTSSEGSRVDAPAGGLTRTKPHGKGGKQRYNFIARHPFCSKCGCGDMAENPLSVDHIVPRSLHGVKGPANWQVLCKSGNQKKGSRMHPRHFRRQMALLAAKEPA